MHRELEPFLRPTLTRLGDGPPHLALEIRLLGLAVNALVRRYVVSPNGGRLAVSLELGVLFRGMPLLTAGEPARGGLPRRRGRQQSLSRISHA
jgi:hypothetical protein